MILQIREIEFKPTMMHEMNFDEGTVLTLKDTQDIPVHGDNIIVNKIYYRVHRICHDYDNNCRIIYVYSEGLKE